MPAAPPVETTGLGRTTELYFKDYLARLSPNDQENVYYIRFSLRRFLLQHNVPSALIAVGSTVTGVTSTDGYAGSGGPNDLDLKVILGELRAKNRYVQTIQEWTESLSIEQFPLKGVFNPSVERRLFTRYTHHGKSEEDYGEMGYDCGLILHPARGKPLDLIVKNPIGLRARAHLAKERELGNAFCVIYTD